MQFSPWADGSAAAREFLARISSAGVRKSNPECIVEAKVRLKGRPVISVEYANKHKEVIPVVGLTAPELLERIKGHSLESDTRDMLKKAGLEGTQLQSGWGSAQAHNAGIADKVPIV